MGANVLLVRSALGWSERERMSSTAAYGRMEAMLTLGSTASEAEVIRLGEGQLDDFAEPRVQTDIVIEPPTNADTPYVGYAPVGATVGAESVSHRMLAVTVNEDEDGEAHFVPSLNDQVVLRSEERIAQWLGRMIRGSLGGRSRIAQPVVPVGRIRSGATHATGMLWIRKGDAPDAYEGMPPDSGLLYGLRADGSSVLAEFDPIGDTWTPLSAPSIITGASSDKLFSYGGALYYFNVSALGSPYTTRTQKYTLGGAWDAGNVLTPDPVKRIASAGGIDPGTGKVYLAAGVTSAGSTAAFESYTIGGGWATLANAPISGFSGGGAFAGGSFWIWDNPGASNDAWRYDVGSDTWFAAAPAPVAGLRARPNGILDDGRIILTDSANPATVYLFDPGAESYEKVDSIPTVPYGIGAPGDGAFYVVGNTGQVWKGVVP